MTVSKRRGMAALGWIPGLCLLLVLGGCNFVEKARPRAREAPVSEGFIIDAPPIMRGTIASEAVIEGFDPIPVHGWGLVVGLNGTGSADIPPDVFTHMVAVASRHRVGSESIGMGQTSPESIINSPNTAVVVVEGVIDPASPAGTMFDVSVFAHPASSTTSLEGGRLYTTDLVPRVRPQRGVRVLPPAGSQQPSTVAFARGQIFLNPFAEPGAVGRDTITRTQGRILNGGMVRNDLPLKLRLASPNHARVRILQTAINTRFPQEPSQRSTTARGESDETVSITVPPSYADRTDVFVELVRHTTIMQSQAEPAALSVRRYVLEYPKYSEQASWRWQAIGPRALPIIKQLYDHPNQLPRLAALRAGAKLHDPLVTPHLLEIAREGRGTTRREAVRLLGQMPVDPRIDIALREMLDDSDVDVRLAAYEAMVERRDPALRRTIVDDKFVLDQVPSDYPMIYITQAGEPSIVVFGDDLNITRPVLMRTWSNRLMVQGDASREELDVYFQPLGGAPAEIRTASAGVSDFVTFLGQGQSLDHPEGGLGLTYAETVGAIHQIWRQEFIAADFKAQQDRILAALNRLETDDPALERPEFSGSGEGEGDGADFLDTGVTTPVEDVEAESARGLSRGNP